MRASIECEHFVELLSNGWPAAALWSLTSFISSSHNLLSFSFFFQWIIRVISVCGKREYIRIDTVLLSTSRYCMYETNTKTSVSYFNNIRKTGVTNFYLTLFKQTTLAHLHWSISSRKSNCTTRLTFSEHICSLHRDISDMLTESFFW